MPESSISEPMEHDQDMRFSVIPDHWMPLLESRSSFHLIPEDDLENTQKVSQEELKKIQDLDVQIRDLEAYLPTGDTTVLKERYASLRTNTEEAGWKRDSTILAVSISAMMHPPEPYASHKEFGGITDLTISQKLLLVRAQKALENRDEKGLIAIMRAGEGKSFIVPAVLPLMLTYFRHVDVTSLTPTKRYESYKAFKAVAQTLEITMCELDNRRPRIPFPRYGANKDATLVGSSVESHVLDPTLFSVTFALRSEIAHFYERSPNKIQNLDPSENALIADEIDASDVDQATEQFVLSSKEEPVHRVIKRYWNISRFPTEMFSPKLFADANEARRAKNEMKNQWNIHIQQIKTALSHKTGSQLSDIQASQQLLQTKGNSNNEVFACSVLRLYLRSLEELRLEIKEKTSPFFNLQGTTTSAGHEEIKRRMYQNITNTPGESVLLPESWNWTLSQLFPAHVLQAIDASTTLQRSYFIQKNKIQVKNYHTGYPKPRSEFSPLVQFVLYAKESLRHTHLQFPSTLHEIQDMMTSSELNSLRYGFTLGLTGSGRSVARWFEATQQIKSTIIPPTYEDKLIVEPTHGFLSKEQKYAWILSHVQNNMGDNPLLLDIELESDFELLAFMLRQQFGDSHSIQALKAQNADEADAIFSKAGLPKTITLALRMAGREISINSKQVLTVISTSPQELERNSEQISYRTGRFGKNGHYITLTSPEDAIWKKVTEEESILIRKMFPNNRHSLLTALGQNDSSTIEKMMDSIRDANEQDLLLKANSVRWRNQARVLMRRRLSELTPASQVRMQKIWPSLTTLLDTASLHIHFSHVNLENEQLYALFSYETIRLFNRLANKSAHGNFEPKAYNMMNAFMERLDKRMSNINKNFVPRITWFGSSNSRTLNSKTLS